jgi:PST family polysaccharide transporter
MVTSVVGLLAYVGVDLGLTPAIIQKKDLTPEQSNGLFWITAASGACFAVMTCLSGPLLAMFYGKKQLILITMALAPNFIFQGLAVQHWALLSREMRFGTVAVNQFISTLIGVTSGIAAALAGAGYWALVIQQAATAFANCVGLWWLNPWRPGLPKRGVGLRGFLHFGGNVTVFNLLNQLARSSDKIAIGRFCGPADLGYYSRAALLLLLPVGQVMTPLGQVLIPVLSRLQDEPERFRNYFSKSLNALAFAIFIPVAALVALSDDVVLVLLGPAWKQSALLFKLLSLSALTQPLFSAVVWVATTRAKTREMRIWSLISAPLICISFLIGVKWGVVGVAASYTLVYYTIQACGLNYLLRGTPINSKIIFASVWRPALVAAVMFLTASFCQRRLLAHGPVLRIIISSACGFLATGLTVAVWPAARNECARIWEMVKLMRKPAALVPS